MTTRSLPVVVVLLLCACSELSRACGPNEVGGGSTTAAPTGATTQGSGSPSSTTSGTGGGGGGGGGGAGDPNSAQNKAACNFEMGNCGYGTSKLADSKYAGVTGQFNNTSGWLGPQNTGVANASEGTHYYGALLGPGQAAASEATFTPLTADTPMTFDYYEATAFMQSSICTDDTTCQWMSNKDVSKDDRKWKSGSITLPKGASKVQLVAKNPGANNGVAAFDNIKIPASRSLRSRGNRT